MCFITVPVMLDEATQYLENRQVSAPPHVGLNERNRNHYFFIVNETFESIDDEMKGRGSCIIRVS